MIICVDVDNVLNDLAIKTLDLYNNRTGKNIQIENITSYNFFDCLPQEDANAIIALFEEKELWDSLKPLPNSQDVLKLLIKNGHRVYLATATNPINFKWKVDWTTKYFPFISSDNIIRIMDKSILKCDIMIDDHLDNLIGNFCDRICIDYPWNRSSSKDVSYDIKRANNWNDVPLIINNIEKEMEEWKKW